MNQEEWSKRGIRRRNGERERNKEEERRERGIRKRNGESYEAEGMERAPIPIIKYRR